MRIQLSKGNITKCNAKAIEHIQPTLGRHPDLNKLSDFIASTQVEQEKKTTTQYKNSQWFGVADNLLKICDYYIARFLHHKSAIYSQLQEMKNTNPEAVDFLLLWLQDINSNNDSIYQDRNYDVEVKDIAHMIKIAEGKKWTDHIFYQLMIIKNCKFYR